MPKYGKTITWTQHRETVQVSVRGCESIREAAMLVIGEAVLDGWLPPRRWQ